MKSQPILKYGTILCAALLFIGETIILLKTDKYLPLSLDDYFACVCLMISAYLIQERKYLPLLMASWAFVVGNMYAMLFSRLDPLFGSGERIGLLIVVNLIAIGFLSLSFVVWKNEKGDYLQ